MTKQQIIDAVLECAEKLGHTPSHTEVMKDSIVSRNQIRWHFGSYARLLRECHLEGSGSGYKVELDDLFRDWAGIARDLKKIPTIAEFEREEPIQRAPADDAFWKLDAGLARAEAVRRGARLGRRWRDVMEIIEAKGEERRGRARRSAVVQGPDNAGGAGRSAAAGGQTIQAGRGRGARCMAG